MGVHRWAEASAGTRKLFRDASTAVDYYYWLTDFLSRRNGCPGSDVEAHDGWHAGHIFATSLTVLHEDVDLTRLKPDCGINPDDAPWPARLKCYWMNDRLWLSPWQCFFFFWIEYQPKKNNSTEGTYCKVHWTVIVHVHRAVDAASKVLQARSQIYSSYSLRSEQRQRTIEWKLENNCMNKLNEFQTVSFHYIWQALYLFVFTQNSALLTKENINGSFVVIFQWSSHHQVIEAIAIQIRDRSQRRPKASILAAIMDFQRTFKDEAILLKERKSFHKYLCDVSMWYHTSWS